MTRSSSLLLLSALALAGAGAAEARRVCSTLTVDQRGTRTYTAADETTTIVKTRQPCTSTVKTVTTPKAKTITSNVPVYTTTTVTGVQETDFFISTRTSFIYESPTTTLTADTTPTVTETSTLDAATTITSYTLVPPAATAPARRRRDNRLQASDLGRRQARGKDVYCHDETTITSTQSKPCTTITSTSTAPRKTITTKVPLSVTITKTKAPAHATKTVYVVKKSTITADLATAYTTNTFTTTQTVPAPSETAIVGEYPECEFNLFDWVTSSAVGEGANYATTTAKRPQDCCHAAASIPGAVFFAYNEDTHVCSMYSAYIDYCPTNVQYTVGDYELDDNGRWASLLQCGVQGTVSG